MLEKPTIGDPCNGCGLCCKTVICATGSFTMGLVERYGDRVPGPCPALVENKDSTYACGLVLRPKDNAPSKSRASHDLREAVKLLIGAGAGCDEIGDEDPGEADNLLQKMQEDYLNRHGKEKISAAVKIWYGA